MIDEAYEYVKVTDGMITLVSLAVMGRVCCVTLACVPLVPLAARVYILARVQNYKNTYAYDCQGVTSMPRLIGITVRPPLPSRVMGLAWISDAYSTSLSGLLGQFAIPQSTPTEERISGERGQHKSLKGACSMLTISTPNILATSHRLPDTRDQYFISSRWAPCTLSTTSSVLASIR